MGRVTPLDRTSTQNDYVVVPVTGGRFTVINCEGCYL